MGVRADVVVLARPALRGLLGRYWFPIVPPVAECPVEVFQILYLGELR
jgi:hypothetical protein